MYNKIIDLMIGQDGQYYQCCNGGIIRTYYPFIIYLILKLAMRTNSLFMNLLANTSANPRSNSLIHHQFPSNQAPMVRSSSNNNSEKLSDIKATPQLSLDKQKYIPLFKINYLVNLKIKNQYYFAFCKMEQIFKNGRNIIEAKRELQAEEKKLQIVHSEVESHLQERYQNSNKINKSEKDLEKILNILCDSFSMLKSKIQIRQEKTKLLKCFGALRRVSKRIKSCEYIENTVHKIQQKAYLFGFISLKRLEKIKMSSQILGLSLEQTVNNSLLNVFKMIRQFAQKSAHSLKQCKSNYVERVPYESAIVQRKVDESLTIFSNNSQYNNKSRKIIIRQKKMQMSTPITMNMRNKKYLEVHIIEDIPIVSNQFCKQLPMARSLHQKQQYFNNCMPDLHYNCNIFSEDIISIPITCQDNRAVFVQNIDTETTEKNCQSQRFNIRHVNASCSTKNTPMTKKASITNLVGSNKRDLIIQNNEQSPLAKIDEILSKIQQMKSYASVERLDDKVMVSVNLSKFIYEPLSHRTPNKSQIKTPSKKTGQQELLQFRLEDKENIRQRLVTERDKLNKSSKKSSINFESAGKQKSTMINKSNNKGKQKGEVFTAKKMKMEIENIINRRNKQLSYRNETNQLK